MYIQLYVDSAVPAGHILEYHFITLFEPAHNFNIGHRPTAKLHLNAGSSLAIGINLKHAYGALLLAESRTSYIEHIIQALQGDRTVYAQVRTHALGQLAFQLHVHGDGSILHRRINTHDRAFDDAVMRINFRALPKLDVLGLGFGNLQFRLEMFR